jgi:hypothetical protein
MRLLRQLALLPLIIAIVVSQTACPEKQTALTISKEVTAALGDTITIFQANGLSVARLQEAQALSSQLVAVLESTDTDGGNAATIVAGLITKFTQLVAESEQIADPRTRTIVLVSLAVTNILLRRLADKIDDLPVAVRPSATGTRAVRTVTEFRTRPKWRCRNSQTGRFEKMSFCEKHPDVSQVETR